MCVRRLQYVALNYSPPPLSHTLLLLSLLIFYCIPSFLLLRISSPAVYFPFSSHSCITFLFFLLTSSAHFVLCCRLFFCFFLPPPPLTLLFLLSISSLYLSPVLSALRRVSAITPFHLLITVLIQPSTHSCLTSLYAALTNICTHTHTRVCRLAQMSPRMRGAQWVHTLTPAYCAEKCPL